MFIKPMLTFMLPPKAGMIGLYQPNRLSANASSVAFWQADLSKKIMLGVMVTKFFSSGMNILFLNDHYSKEGGTERYIEVVTKALRGKGHQVVTVVGDSQDKPPAEITLVPKLNLKAVLSFATDRKIDVINVQTVESIGLHKALPKHFPAVRLLHDTASVCKYHFRSTEICAQKLTLGHCLNAAATENSMTKNPLTVASLVTTRQGILKELATWPVLLANSEFTKHTYVAEGVPAANIKVIPMFPTVTPSNTAAKKEDNVVLFSGRIYKEKGLEYLIRAFSRVRSQAELWVVGEGWDTARCKQLAIDFSLGEWIRFWGFLEGDKLVEVYAKASIGVVPSMWGEPFGLSGIEMMAFGMPVVGFDSGGIQEWLHSNETGFLVGRGDTDGLAEKINMLLLDKEKRQQLGAHAQVFVATNYTITAHLAVLEDAYQRAVATFKKS